MHASRPRDHPIGAHLDIGSTLSWATTHYRPVLPLVLPVLVVQILALVAGESAADYAAIGGGRDDAAMATLAVVLGLVAQLVTIGCYIVFAQRINSHAVPRPAGMPEEARYPDLPLLPVIGFLLLYALAVVAGTVLLVIPGIYLFVRLFFGDFYIILRGARVTDAFRQAWELVRGFWWSTAGMLLVMALLVYLPLMLLALLLGMPAANDMDNVESVPLNVILLSNALLGTAQALLMLFGLMMMLYWFHALEHAQERKKQGEAAGTD